MTQSIVPTKVGQQMQLGRTTATGSFRWFESDPATVPFSFCAASSGEMDVLNAAALEAAIRAGRMTITQIKQDQSDSHITETGQDYLAS